MPHPVGYMYNVYGADMIAQPLRQFIKCHTADHRHHKSTIQLM